MATPLTPQDLQSFLDAHGVQARLIHELGETPTVPAAAQALGVESDQIIKTLLFLIDRAEAEPGAIVVIGSGERAIDRRTLAEHVGVGKKRIRLAPAQTVLELLGYPAGGVPPFGHRTQLPVIVDAAVLTLRARYGGVVYGGGGDDRTMMELSVDELLRMTSAEVLAIGGEP